ncbi:hypothetical protein EVAR_18723_1 [Eumeta japonica]|uniref:Uncharacterized protein n=1 Tax=Eumeta variegata TaxID=151549 RepID=A0A4C1UMX4_EUMVA|nr:hypothetical protein EVAR_18723_1 [Eumeta japonica]
MARRAVIRCQLPLGGSDLTSTVPAPLYPRVFSASETMSYTNYEVAEIDSNYRGVGRGEGYGGGEEETGFRLFGTVQQNICDVLS